MNLRKLYPCLIIAIIAGCTGIFGISNLDNKKEHDLRAGNIPSSIHPEWRDADRCTKCHLTWSWEFGYYRGWDRHGLISDYAKTSPFGYKDPYGLDVPVNTFIDYYYKDWWNDSWLKQRKNIDPQMHFGGYDKVNDGLAKSEDFNGPVIVVDKSGRGDARTIQEAVNKAQPGTTVFVKAGTYRESVRLKEGIILWGEDAHTTIIDPDLMNSAIIAANNCDISGFTVTGTGMNYKEYIFSAGVHALDCDSTLVIRGNIFYNNAVFGILVENSRAGGTPVKQFERYIKPLDTLKNIEYTGYPNPRIIGNTFYLNGERAVYCIHSAPEITNNIFIGNVKTMGMTQHSHPFIHHNVFYRNSASLNINRSIPVISHNIMIQNYWGQRIIEGSYPFIHNNVTWKSPYFKDFGEDGKHIPFTPCPGDGEQEVDPGFVDPDAGNFQFADDSPLLSLSGPKSSYGLVTGTGIQQPPVVACEHSSAEDFGWIGDWEMEEWFKKIITSIERQNDSVKNLRVSYSIDYKSYMEVEYDQYGDQVTVAVRKQPVSGIHYEVPEWIMHDGIRRKTYKSELFSSTRSLSDSGTVIFDGEKLTILSGRFKQYCKSFLDPHNIGEKPVRENIGGLYLDYDQFLNGAIGPGGTFYYGYPRIIMGALLEERAIIDGHKCIVVRYSHIGADQFYKFYLDPKIGYRPWRLEQYFDAGLYRRIDSYVYVSDNGINLPISVKITDYAVKKPHIGKVIGITVMNVKPGSLILNDRSLEIAHLLPEPLDFIEAARTGT